jgi:peptidoglycan/LPS O-acetylase OafA/YrhL
LFAGTSSVQDRLRFGVARFARLYLAIGLFILLWRHWAKLPTEFPDAWLFIPLMQAWIPGSIPASAAIAIPQLGHTWSISVEMFLYLCFPAILRAPRRAGWLNAQASSRSLTATSRG